MIRGSIVSETRARYQPDRADPIRGTALLPAAAGSVKTLLRRGCAIANAARRAQAMNGMSSGAIVTNGRIMSRSSCSRMWQWYMYRPL